MHEHDGFDRVLIGYCSFTLESMQLASYLSHRSNRLVPRGAHRPGFVAQTLTASPFATLDQLNGGQVAINVITVGTTPSSNATATSSAR